MDTPNDRVVPLEELSDYEVARGEPDVRGWDVIAADGRRIGEVEELLVDHAARKVRYLEVGVSHEVSAITDRGPRRILIPIDYTRLHEEADQVYVEELSSDRIDAIPNYDRAAFDRSFEMALQRHFRGTDSDPGELYGGEPRGGREPGAIVARERAIVELPTREVDEHGGSGAEPGLGRE